MRFVSHRATHKYSSPTKVPQHHIDGDGDGRRQACRLRLCPAGCGRWTFQTLRPVSLLSCASACHDQSGAHHHPLLICLHACLASCLDSTVSGRCCALRTSACHFGGHGQLPNFRRTHTTKQIVPARTTLMKCMCSRWNGRYEVVVFAGASQTSCKGSRTFSTRTARTAQVMRRCDPFDKNPCLRTRHEVSSRWCCTNRSFPVATVQCRGRA